jgi:hypothetical protein
VRGDAGAPTAEALAGEVGKEAGAVRRHAHDAVEGVGIERGRLSSVQHLDSIQHRNNVPDS